MSKKIRVDKLLADMGMGSRKDLKTGIKKGKVRVNGKPIKDPGTKVDVEVDAVEFMGRLVEYKAYAYIMLNKPGGCVSATHDNMHQTVIDLVSDDYGHYDLFPVGRLDKDTEGLLILTNDGQFSHNLLSPKKHVDKTYYAKIKGLVTQEDVKRFKEGLELEKDFTTMPAQLKILTVDEASDQSEIEVVIQEGKFHQVKRMFLAVDKEVTYLKRIQMGNLKLDEELALGEYRELTLEEMERIK